MACGTDVVEEGGSGDPAVTNSLDPRAGVTREPLVASGKGVPRTDVPQLLGNRHGVAGEREPNPVPLIVTSPARRLRGAPGLLADVAPTVLELLGIPQPAEMTGRSLLEEG